MSIAVRVHEPWHYRNFEPVLRHLRKDEYTVLVSHWMHRREDLAERAAAQQATLDWLTARGVPARVESSWWPDVFLTLSIDARQVPMFTHRQVRLLYAVIDKDYTYSDKQKHYDLILVASTFGRELMARHNIPAEVVGYPKLDPFFRGEITREIARAQLGLSAEQSVVLYAPTFGDYSTIELYADALAALDPSIVLLVQLHPVSYLSEPQLIAKLPERARLISPIDAGIETLIAADLVISDYSGAAFEACALDRPVLLLDLPQAPKDQAVERQYRDFGPRVARAEQLAAGVEAALADSSIYRERRAYYRETFYEYRGKAGARAAQALRQQVEMTRMARKSGTARV